MNARRAWAEIGSLATLLAASSCFNVGDDDDGGGTTSAGGLASGGSVHVSTGGIVSTPGTGGIVSTPSTGGIVSTGGVSSAGGNTGAAAGECAICDHSQACCLAIAAVENLDTDPCLTFAETTCSSLSGPARAAIVNACQSYLQKQMVRDLAACH